MKVYKVEKAKTILLMERNRSRVSLTTDMWTANNQKRGFMVVTAHFIEDSWKLQSRILRTLMNGPSSSRCLRMGEGERERERQGGRHISLIHVNSLTNVVITVVLDPRFKMSLIEYYYKRIYGEERGEKMKEEVQKHCYDLLMLYQGKNKEDNNESSSSRHGVNGPSTYLRSTSTLSDYEVFLQNLKRTKTVHSKSELDHNLKEAQLPRSEKDEFDILAWWESNGLKYPTLQAITRDVLAVPVSTVASESSFSTGGRMVSSSCNRLHPTTLEAFMCSQSWLAAFEDGEIPTINDGDKDVDNDGDKDVRCNYY